MPSTKLKAIPCNIITGFLGVGKTTTILNLLKQKPSDEKWAVLVNEFGEIGIDGALMEAEQEKNTGVFIREVPGGCMCCASGLPMQVALNMLLMKAKPDRLLIEPTGLGHPKEVINILSSSHYQDVLALENTLTLVDARHFSSPKHLSNQTFQQQLEVADLLVVNKSDLASEKDIQTFKAYLSEQAPLNLKSFMMAENGKIGLECLDKPHSETEIQTVRKIESARHTHKHSLAPMNSSNTLEPIPECGFLVKSHQKGEFTSMGWRFNTDINFDIEAVLNWLNTLNACRVKAVLNSTKGLVTINLPEQQNKAVAHNKTKHATESRLEVIFEDQYVTEDFISTCTERLLALIV